MILYTVVFEDNTVFRGGDLIDTKWMEMPDKKISSIFYSLPFGGILLLKGMEKYYCGGEIAKDVFGSKGMKLGTKIENSYLIGKKGSKYLINKISWVSGNIERKIVDENDNLIRQLIPMGWKNGKEI